MNNIELKKQSIIKFALENMEFNKMDENLLMQGWTFKFNKRLTRSIGRCNFTKKEIELSYHFLPTLTESEWKDTVLHEIAHALAFPIDRGHGRYWQTIAKMLGATPSHSTILSNPPKRIPKYILYFVNNDGTFDKVAQYKNKPRRDFSSTYIRGRQDETIGKLQLTTYDEYTKMGGKL